MRTTLTLDDDVAVLLTRVRQQKKLGLKQAVNEALRQGLKELMRPSEPRTRFRTPSTDVGRCLIGDVDNVAEVLAIIEGEDYR